MKLILILLGCLHGGAAFAGNAVISCPPSIDVIEQPTQIAGWITYQEQTPYFFVFAQFSDGPPALQQTLMHHKESRSGKDKVLHYFFSPPQEPWLICSYFDTKTTLARKLPTATRTCQITLDHMHNFQTVKEIRCNGDASFHQSRQ